MGNKRRLSDQQRNRIARQQHKSHATATAGAFDESTLELGREQLGLLISHFGQQADIEALEGDLAGTLHRCFFRANLDPLVVGDRVIWCPADPTGVVVAAQPRSSELLRPDNRGNMRPVAANIDQICLVIAPQPEPFQNLIDRYLVAAELHNLPVVLVINKADLLGKEDKCHSLSELYASVGLKTVVVSATSGEGLASLSSTLNGNTSIFVGQSGVGKSSLLNALDHDADALTGDLSEARVKGTHTTTTSRLYHLPSGGSLIDSPGIREFGLWHVTPEQVMQGFCDLRNHAANCKFRDCRHLAEPGCQLKQALQSGAVRQERVDSYHSIVQSLS